MSCVPSPFELYITLLARTVYFSLVWENNCKNLPQCISLKLTVIQSVLQLH